MPRRCATRCPPIVCLRWWSFVTQLVARQRDPATRLLEFALVLSSFLAILALGQGTVILTGGLDLSVPWTIGLCGILLAGMVQGSDAALIYALPTVLCWRCVIGLVNGVGIVDPRPLADRHDARHERHAAGRRAALFERHAGRLLLAAAALVHDRQGSAACHAGRRCSSSLFVIARRRCCWGARRSAARVYGIGNGARAARALRHRRSDRTLILVYMLSAFCAALVGILLTGFSGPGEPRHGRRLPAAVDRRGGGRRRADHRRARPLSRHAGRRAAAHRACRPCLPAPRCPMPPAPSSSASSCSARSIALRDRRKTVEEGTHR